MTDLHKSLEKSVCFECEKELDAKNKDDFYNEICADCLEKYPNETGYCSVSCRISGKCDESC